MKNEPALRKSDSKPRRKLDKRLAKRPAMLERLHQIVDTLEQSVGELLRADPLARHFLRPVSEQAVMIANETNCAIAPTPL